MTWWDVARLTLLSHARSPWAVVFLSVSLAPVLLFLVAFTSGVPDYGLMASLDVLDAPPLSLLGTVGTVLCALLLAVVLHAFRGAWLTDPEGARDRIPGFYAGTLGAVALGLLPAALLWLGILAWQAPALWLNARLALTHLAAALLLSSAWIALLLLVCAAVGTHEGRWASAFLTWALLALVVPALAAFSYGLGGEDRGLIGASVPPWAPLVDALSPWRAADLLLESSAAVDTSPWREAYEAAFPRLYHPFTFAAALLLWTAIPLSLATRLRSRRAPFDPAPEVAP